MSPATRGSSRGSASTASAVPRYHSDGSAARDVRLQEPDAAGWLRSRSHGRPAPMWSFSERGLYCVRTTTSLISELTQLQSVKSMIRYLPAKGTAGLARTPTGWTAAHLRRRQGRPRGPASRGDATPRYFCVVRESPADTAVERRIVTVLFCDLVGFTSLSEALDAEDVATMQDAYFAMVRETVGRYGGRLEKFIGDAAMAVFGLPRSRDDDVERAVRAGLAIVGGIQQIGARLGLDDNALQRQSRHQHRRGCDGRCGPRRGAGDRRYGQHRRPTADGSRADDGSCRRSYGARGSRRGRPGVRPADWSSRARPSRYRRGSCAGFAPRPPVNRPWAPCGHQRWAARASSPPWPERGSGPPTEAWSAG